MSLPVRIGLVGCGRIAERGYAPVLRVVRGAVLVAVADPEPARCEVVAPGLPAFPDVSSLLAGADVDGIVVATPAGSHLSDAATAAERGVPSLVEKPPGLDLAEACALRALTPPPSIGFNRRFDPAVRRARSACDARSRARIVVELCGDTRAWAAHEPPPDALLDLGSHAADLAVHVSGRRPVSVRTVSLTPVSGLLEVELDGGGAALLYISNSGRWSERLEVVDRDGRQLARSSRGGMRGRLLARRSAASGSHPVLAELPG